MLDTSGKVLCPCWRQSKILSRRVGEASRHFGTNLLSTKWVDRLALVEARVALGTQEDRASGSSRHALSQSQLNRALDDACCRNQGSQSTR
jgi:hypothetical protein